MPHCTDRAVSAFDGGNEGLNETRLCSQAEAYTSGVFMRLCSVSAPSFERTDGRNGILRRQFALAPMWKRPVLQQLHDPTDGQTAVSDAETRKEKERMGTTGESERDDV